MNFRLIYTITFLFYFFNSYADENFKEITVTSSKLLDEQLTGAVTHVLNEEYIKQYPNDSLVQIISRLPGIEFKSLYGTGFGAKESIDIRGFADTAKSNTLILLNGQRLSNIDASFVDFTTMPVSSIKRIEIIKGGSAGVLYGSNATSGAVNIITDQFIKDDDSYEVSTAFGSFGQFEAAFSGSKVFENFSVSGNANYSKADGYRRNNELRQQNANLEVNSQINTNTLLHLNITGDKQFMGLPGVVAINGWPDTSTDYYKIDRRRSTTLADFATSDGAKAFYSLVHELEPNTQLIVDGSYRFNHSEGFFTSGVTDTKLYSVSLNPKIKISNKFYGKSLKFISGVDSQYTYYNSDRMASDGFPTKQTYKFSDSNLGFYFNTDLLITNTLKIGAGARYQGNWLKASDSVGPASGAGKDFEDSLTFEPLYAYHLGIENNFNEYGTVFGRVSKTFRYPNVDERVGAQGFSVPHDFKMNSQVSNDFEIGHKINYRSFSISNNFYYMRIRGEIIFDAVDFLNKNLPATKRYGYESLLTFKPIDKITISNAFDVIKAKLREGPNYKGKEIPGIPSMINKFNIDFDLLDGLTLFANVNYRGSSRLINDTKNFQIKNPEFVLTNIGIKGNLYGFDYSLVGYNVTNKKYYRYGVGSASTYNSASVYPMPEFTLFGKISKRF
ncbi:MAG: TonB-dependent receptor [Alphaproteobacteria bacterium]